MRILITGGECFIGTNVTLSAIKRGHTVLNVDCLSYAGSLTNLVSIEKHPKYSFEQTDIRDQDKIHKIFENFQPEYIFHLAAESHVDRSIDSAFTVLSTNIMGTCVLLDEFTKYWVKKDCPDNIVFHHISTDEVFGSVKNIKFNEDTKYDPLNPYSVSKASSDHLVRSWINTHHIRNNHKLFKQLWPLSVPREVDSSQLQMHFWAGKYQYMAMVNRFVIGYMSMITLMRSFQ